jgi:hypothetical protein
MTHDPCSTAVGKYRGIEVVMAAALVIAAGVMVTARIVGEDPVGDRCAEEQLDTPESASLYVCPDDGATMSVTPRMFDLMLASGRAGPREGAARRTPGLFIKCPKCGKHVMVEGVRCPTDGTVYAQADAHGEPCVCPHCLAISMARGPETHPADSDAG